MHTQDPALAIDRATQALYATASETREPRAVKLIVVMMVVTVALLAMVPIFASSLQGEGEPTGGALVTQAPEAQTSVSPVMPTP